jgi:hypothetical protein
MAACGGGQTSEYKDGDVFYNQTDMKYYVYNSTGNTWIEAPSPGGGGGSGGGDVITVSGNNPTCPSGSTTLTRDWISESFRTCGNSAGTFGWVITVPGGWSKTAPEEGSNCGFGTYLCSPGGGNTPCYPPEWGACFCAAQNWTMVMCSQ